MSIERQEIDLNTTWREQYIAALQGKLDFLNGQINRADEIETSIRKEYNISAGVSRVYDYHSYKIEALELQHKIFYEQKVLRDWKSQVEKLTVGAEDEKVSEANNNFYAVLNTVMLHSDNHERLKKLLVQYNLTNMADPEQREIIYSHMKRALQMLKIEIK